MDHRFSLGMSLNNFAALTWTNCSLELIESQACGGVKSTADAVEERSTLCVLWRSAAPFGYCGEQRNTLPAVEVHGA